MLFRLLIRWLLDNILLSLSVDRFRSLVLSLLLVPLLALSARRKGILFTTLVCAGGIALYLAVCSLVSVLPSICFVIAFVLLPPRPFGAQPGDIDPMLTVLIQRRLASRLANKP